METSLNRASTEIVDIFSQQIRRPLAVRNAARTLGHQHAQRKYEIMFVDANGDFQEFNTVARALPAFEEAFSALGHNAIVQTRNGYMSVEDVYPGDDVRLADGNYETLLWRGRITLSPGQQTENASEVTMTRVTGDALGDNRPTQDLVLGPAARLLYRSSGIRKVTGCDAAFIPAADFVDGNNILSLRPSGPVSVFQFGFAKQRSLLVNGIEIETLHPGTAFNLGLRGDTLREYLSLFPHKNAFEDFGILENPRLRLRDLELIG